MPNNEFGDFQTPTALASSVLQVLQVLRSRGWTRILEPACGTGNFLRECAKVLRGVQVIGIEVQARYVQEACLSPAEVLQGDIFDMQLGEDLPWATVGPMLVIGNPPWVTNSELSRLDSDNRPVRVNLKNLSGYEAMTGSSNFDIAEYIWLKLITELRQESPTISLLCKTQVARNVLEYCARFNLPVSSASLHRIDAKKWFGAAVDACLFTIDVNAGPASYVCDLYESLGAERPARQFGIIDNRIVADVDSYKRTRWLDAACPLNWRQGMKHDAAAVMELTHRASGPATRTGEPVDVEDEHLYPLLKCTDVFHGRLGLGRWVIVPQKALNEDTQLLARSAPKLWAYLNTNASLLDKRKSSIYRNRPRFCVFGLGPYSFAPFKVAVSGLHKSVTFRLIGPVRAKPVFFDDTCYFLPFEDACEAAAVAALLQTESARDFFTSLTFWDAKRPITKKLLQRIDLAAIAANTATSEIADSAAALLMAVEDIPPYPREALSRTIARLRDAWDDAKTETCPRRVHGSRNVGAALDLPYG